MPVEDLNASTPSGATIMRAAPSRRVALHHDVRRNLMGRKLLQDPTISPRLTSHPALQPTRCDGATDQALALSLTQPFVYGGEHERLRKRMHADKSCSVTARMGHCCWHRGVGPRASGGTAPAAAGRSSRGRPGQGGPLLGWLRPACLHPSTRSERPVERSRSTGHDLAPRPGRRDWPPPPRRYGDAPVRRTWRRGADVGLWTGVSGEDLKQSPRSSQRRYAKGPIRHQTSSTFAVAPGPAYRRGYMHPSGRGQRGITLTRTGAATERRTRNRPSG
ncbi:hypothetical protein K388_05912 [Streptomyces sp. KhCrAH-43]|nr:hypothetical protein K388_05912 [Streptomyces sp. KhCrAH-43]